jgi:hypothetical protein
MRRLSLLALLLLSTLAPAITLEGSTDSLEVVTAGSSISIDYALVYANVTATALTTPGTSVGQITSATTTTVLAAPSAANWRHIKSLNLENSGTVAVTVTVQIDRSASNRIIFSCTLSPSEHLVKSGDSDFHVYTASGAAKADTGSASYSGRALSFSKIGTAIDTVGYHYAFFKDTGFPGANAFGTPGVNGATLDCSTAAGAVVAGSHILPNPASGGWYLQRYGLVSSVANTYEAVDLLWYNTGLTVTTTTLQAITSGAMPARDLNGTTNGEGYQIALYALTALGNAAAVANTTVTYTNSAGTGSRTATFSGSVGFQAPATPVIGTWMPFTLQAGDTGVQSIQGITLGTTYTSGTMSLIVYRPLAMTGVTTANFPSGDLTGANMIMQPGVRLWNGTCLATIAKGAVATTAPLLYSGIYDVMER